MALERRNPHEDERRRYGRVVALSTRVLRRRLALTLAISLVVSTEILFQPLPAAAADLGYDLWRWLVHAAECVVMGMVIMVTLTCAEAATRGWPRGPAFALYAAALVAGALGGELLRIALQGFDWTVVRTRPFWSDAVFWMAIGHGNATLHFLQQRGLGALETLHRAQVRRVALEQQVMEARLNLMRAQIEPHFLFNALANMRRLCRDDVRSGMVMLHNLTCYLRAMLPQVHHSPTTLAQETDLVAAYLGILKVRMGARLRYLVEIPAGLAGIHFPPMMLLTLAENAIKHGLAPAPQGGSVVVRARATPAHVEVSITDDGVGFAAAPTGGSGVGLANTRDRLAALYGDAGLLTLESNTPSGVRATIRIPFAAGVAPGLG